MIVMVSNGEYSDWSVVALVEMPEADVVLIKQKLENNRVAVDVAFKHLIKMTKIVELEPHRKTEQEAARLTWDKLQDEASQIRAMPLAYPKVPYQELYLG